MSFFWLIIKLTKAVDKLSVFFKYVYKITLKSERMVYYFKVVQPSILGKYSPYFPPLSNNGNQCHKSSFKSSGMYT